MIKTSIFEKLAAISLSLLVLVLPFIKGGMLEWVAPVLMVTGLFMFISMAAHKAFYTEINVKDELAWFAPLFVLTAWVALQLFVFPGIFGWYAVFTAEDIQGTFFEDFTTPVDLITSFRWLGYFFVYWAVVWVSANLRLSLIKPLLWLMVAVSGLIAVYSLIAYVGGHKTILGIWEKTYFECCATGTFVNRNHFANFLAISAPIALFCFFSRNSGESVKSFVYVLAITYMIITLSAVLTSQSRMGVTALMVGLMVWVVYFFKSIKSVESSVTYMRYVVVSIIVALLAWVLWFGFEDVLYRFLNGEMSDARSEFRQTMYSLPIKAWILGIQPGVFPDVYSYYADSDTNVRLSHAHNDYLEFFLEIGVIGSTLFILSCFPKVLAIFNAGKSYFKALSVPVIMVMLIHSLVDFNMHIPSNAVYFFIAVGLLANRKVK